MTCVAATVCDGVITMGADSAGISGWNLTVRADPKVFRVGDFLIGFTSSFRMGQILQYSFTPPSILDYDLPRYMATLFVDELRATFKRQGYAKTDNGTETGGTFLVGIYGRLFEINSDYQVGESRDPWAAVGCGAQVALGALWAGCPVSAALEASERLCAGVRGPFTILTLP